MRRLPCGCLKSIGRRSAKTNLRPRPMCDECYERVMLGHYASLESVYKPQRVPCTEQGGFEGEPFID